MADSAGLTINDLSVAYGPVRALFGVSMELPAGSITALLGPNGAGKSTFARALSGLVPKLQGTVSLAGQDITDWPAYRIRRAGLVHIPEGRGIFPGLSVADNLTMAVRRVGSRSVRGEATERAYDLFPAIADRRNQRAGSLSGGEQQMLALARALAVSPRLLIADELSLGLAPRIVEAVFESLDVARREGVTTILIEQFVHRALTFADFSAILVQGQVVWTGAAKDARQEVLDRYLGHHGEARANAQSSNGA